MTGQVRTSGGMRMPATPSGARSEAPPPVRRTGPRPLALHLAAAASPMDRGGGPGCAAEAAARLRLAAFLRGLRAYRGHPYRRDLPEPPVAWRRGTTRLLDYAPSGGGLPVVVVPSLVNPAHILDHGAGRSLLRHLAAIGGLRPFLVDWGAPGPEELGFSLTDYVVRRLEPALAAARDAAGGRRPPAAVVGYCMGGLLTVALAGRRRDGVAGLALLATPWDFHAGGPRLPAPAAVSASLAVAALGVLPVPLLQALFAALDPPRLAGRYARLAALDPAGPEARAFVALEDWANDGVPVAARVAQECLLGWYGANTPHRGAWRVAGEAVRPRDLGALPAFVAVPDRDRIVPPASAAALACALAAAEVHRPAAGHVGMVAGDAAPRTLWPPLAAWLRRLAAMHT